jgi:hypothetical protein
MKYPYNLIKIIYFPANAPKHVIAKKKEKEKEKEKEKRY